MILNLPQLCDLAVACAYSIGVSFPLEFSDISAVVEADLAGVFVRQRDTFDARLEEAISQVQVPFKLGDNYTPACIREKMWEVLLKRIKGSDEVKAALAEGYIKSNELKQQMLS